MSIGSSGRIVIGVEPSVKRLLYAALAKEGSTLKDWFLKNADAYLATDLPTDLRRPLTQTSDACDSNEMSDAAATKPHKSLAIHGKK